MVDNREAKKNAGTCRRWTVWAPSDSNREPAGYEPAALTVELEALLESG